MQRQTSSTHDQLRHLEFVAEHADASQKAESLVHEQGVENWYRQLDVAEMSRTLVRRQVAGRTATEDSAGQLL